MCFLTVYLLRCVKSGPDMMDVTGLFFCSVEKDGDQIPSRCIPSGLVRGGNLFFFSRSGSSLEQDGVMRIQLLLCDCIAMVKKSDFYSEKEEFEA